MFSRFGGLRALGFARMLHVGHIQLHISYPQSGVVLPILSGQNHVVLRFEGPVCRKRRFPPSGARAKAMGGGQLSGHLRQCTRIVQSIPVPASV